MVQPCPICKNLDFTTLFDRQLRNRICSLGVFCPMEKNGCMWQGRYEDLELHLNVGKVNGECLYISVPCPFSCDESFLRLHLRRHMTRDCKNRHNQCQLCYGCAQSGNGARDQHSPGCPNRYVDCPNGCPIPNIRFCDLDEHTTQLCPFREIQCKFQQFSCLSSFKFRDGPRHYVEKSSHHLELIRRFLVNHAGLEEAYRQLVQRCADLEQENQETKEKVGGLETKCAGYELSIAELREMVRSLKELQEHPPARRDTWEEFPSPDSAHFLPLAPPPSRRESAEEAKTDPFCFRP